MQNSRVSKLYIFPQSGSDNALSPFNCFSRFCFNSTKEGSLLRETTASRGASGLFNAFMFRSGAVRSASDEGRAWSFDGFSERKEEKDFL